MKSLLQRCWARQHMKKASENRKSFNFTLIKVSSCYGEKRSRLVKHAIRSFSEKWCCISRWRSILCTRADSHLFISDLFIFCYLRSFYLKVDGSVFFIFERRVTIGESEKIISLVYLRIGCLVGSIIIFQRPLIIVRRNARKNLLSQLAEQQVYWNNKKSDDFKNKQRIKKEFLWTCKARTSRGISAMLVNQQLKKTRRNISVGAKNELVVKRYPK